MRRKYKVVILIIILTFFLGSAAAFAAIMTESTSFNVGVKVYIPPPVIVQWIAPEGRVGAIHTNWDDLFYMTVKTLDGSGVYTMNDVVSSTNDGSYLRRTTFNNMEDPGVYNIYLKGWQHITRKLGNIYLDDMTTNTLNFTQADNSAPLGPVVLLAGDINGAGNSTTTMGDDVINSVDLSILLSRIDDDDPTGNVVRANLNQDIVVNSVDLSLLLKNLDAEGDK